MTDCSATRQPQKSSSTWQSICTWKTFRSCLNMTFENCYVVSFFVHVVGLVFDESHLSNINNEVKRNTERWRFAIHNQTSYCYHDCKIRQMTTFTTVHLASMCTRCFRETGSPSHNFFVKKKKKKKINAPDFKFYLAKLQNKKKNPIWCNVKFECFHCNKQFKKQRRSNIAPYGENSIS